MTYGTKPKQIRIRLKAVDYRVLDASHKKSVNTAKAYPVHLFRGPSRCRTRSRNSTVLRATR